MVEWTPSAFLSVSPPMASGQQCVIGRICDDGKSGYIDFAHFGGNIFGNIDKHLRRAVTEGGGPKLNFRDKNPGSNLVWPRDHRLYPS